MWVVIGYQDHDGPNQRVINPLSNLTTTPELSNIYLQWTFEQQGAQWAIKSSGSGKYIGIEGPPENGTPLVAVDNTVLWDIWPDERDNSHLRCVTTAHLYAYTCESFSANTDSSSMTPN